MIQYQQVKLSTAANVGQPGPLPHAILGLSDASLANLPAALNVAAVAALGFADTGYLPVVTADVPQSVTRLQFITALQAAGSYNAVANAINALPNTDPTKIYFLNAKDFGRQDARLLAFAASMAQSAAQVDAVFIAASAVPQ